MDFLANLIKRPNSSITQTENNTDSKTEPCINAETSSSVPTVSESSSKPTYTSTSQITLAMNRCNIDTDFDKLFDSAVQDINNMEEQHNQIIENTTEPVDCVEPLIRPNTSQETISQLLHDMNVNLDQVSEYEMEHLQAMSLEFSPLAVRPSPRHSMEQQKALIAAMRSPSQPSTPTTPNSADPLRSLDVEPPMLKFIGLPEFDETQIPELATELSSNIDPLSCTVLKVGGEQDYNSDSEIYAECVSLNSAKFSADHSELDAYSSALNVLDNNLFNATATTLDNTLSEAAASVHNDSCEPMDIDDINETMELLRDVLAPEDCKLVQESCLGGATKQSNESVKELKEDNEPKEEQVQEPTIKEQSMQQANPAPISTKVEHQVLPQEHAMPKTSSPPISPPLPTMQTIPVKKLTAAAPVSPKTSAVDKQSEQDSAAVSPCTLKVELPQTLNVSPPIPTHRPKTAEELAELRALEAYAEPPVAQEKEEEQKQVQSKAKEETQKQAAVSVKPIASVEPIQSKQKSFTALELNISHSTLRGENSAPSSPSFPMKSPAVSPTQFPRSPYAPVEHDMPYLEVANIEASAEHKVSPSGVIGKSPPQMQVTITEASPEQVKEETPLNGTFDSGNSPHTTSIDTNADATRRATFGVPLDAASEQKRRTFTMIETQTSKRRTMTVEKNHTSPALEATEENIMSDELEPMDVDVSMRVETNQLAENQTVEPTSSPLSTQQAKDCQPETHSPTIPMQQQHHPKPLHSSPPLVGQLKRPSIHKATLQPTCPNATVVLEEQTLSVKEQLSVGDEKDVYVDHFGAMSPITDDIFKPPQYTSSTFSIMARSNNIGAANAAAAAAATAEFEDSEFQDGACNNNIILNSSDLDYLFTKGSNNAPIDRSSLLLKFDPLLGAPVPVNHLSQQEQTLLSILSITGSNNSSSNSNNNNNNNITRALSPTLEEHETSGSNQFEEITKKHANMSVDVIGNDCNKTFDDSNLNSEEKTHKYHNMDELEKKIKNEVTRSEDIENKLREAEQREEALVKRITEKDKNNAKLNGVIEAYEKAIAELIHDKEQLVQNHERQMAEVQADRDSNYTHLMSLETTFSDLHVKYEKSKEMTSHLKQIEENLLEEKKKLIDKLRQQEQRYEQMKSHAMQQMEIANKKLCTLTKEHTDEVKKLKALLKKEEVSRISTAEQLQQKSRENADLLKICEELIYDKGQGGSS